MNSSKHVSKTLPRTEQNFKVWLYLLAKRLLFAVWMLGQSGSSYAVSGRPNVVAEVPGLDVGPLVSVTVARGDTARLPCRHPTYADDTVNLVLWYLNHTSRPFLSYDARDKTDVENGRKRRMTILFTDKRSRKRRKRRRRRRSIKRKEGPDRPKENETYHDHIDKCTINRTYQRHLTPLSRERTEEEQEKEGIWTRGMRGKSSKERIGTQRKSKERIEDRVGRRRRGSNRMSLDGGDGTSLVIQDVNHRDQAEYRCRVHFKLSPTWTQRLLLTVPDFVYNVELTDATGIPLKPSGVGPLAEGDTLNLACQANHGGAEVMSLEWLLEGVQVDTTWASAQKGVAINQLTISSLEQHHRNARLTCRLTTSDASHPNIAANITDASTLINMFYLPESKLLVEGGERSEDGGGMEVLEGKTITFYCSVRADPPAYNITWLHNGRVVPMGGRRWRRDNTSLVITPVDQEDSGLYTCLASNSEGDGHSNALHLKVAHTPVCSGQASQHMVVTANTTVNLSCEMEALPHDIVFTWMVTSPPLKPKGGKDPSEGPVNNAREVLHLSNTLDVSGQPIPGSSQWVTHFPTPREVPPLPPSWQEVGQDVPPLPLPSLDDEDLEPPIPEGSRLHHRLDSSSPTKSHVTITPTAPVRVFCYARNRVGRTRVPCTYALNVVEPPGPLQGCNITVIGETKIEVKCDAHAHIKNHLALDDAHQLHRSPNLGFVRSPEASARANLEVWSNGTLLANVSNSRPDFKVQGLPSAAPLQLILYSVTDHTKSSPVYKYARTLPRTALHLTVPPLPPEPAPSEPSKKSSSHDTSGGMGGLAMTIGALVGGLGISIFILVAVIMVMRRRQKRRMAEEEIVSEHLSAVETKEISSLTIPVLPSPGEISHIALMSHTPPPPKMLLRSTERLSRSKEYLRSCDEICFRLDRANCSSEGMLMEAKMYTLPRVK